MIDGFNKVGQSLFLSLGGVFMSALIIVDLQKDFMSHGALAVEDAEKIIPMINRVLKEPFKTVVASKDWHPLGHVSFASTHHKKVGDIMMYEGLEQHLWPDHCVQGAPGAEFVDTLNQAEIKKIFYKGSSQHVDSYSAFFDNLKKRSTGLHEFLKEREIKKIIIVGVALEFCVKSTALDARKLGYEVVVIREGVASLAKTEEERQRCFLTLEQEGVQVINLNNFLKLN